MRASARSRAPFEAVLRTRKGSRPKQAVPPCPECGETNWAVIYDLTLGVGVTSEAIVQVVIEGENLGPIQSVAYRDCDFQIYGEEAQAHPAARLAEDDHDWPHLRFGW